MNRILIWGYNFFYALALPFLILYFLCRQGLRYLHNLHERFGFFKQPRSFGTSKCIMIHATSIGETRAVQAVVATLCANLPSLQIILTHMTAAGYETSQKIFKTYIQRKQVKSVYLPYDLAPLQSLFLKSCRPDLVLLVEEIWPNLLLTAKKMQIPVILANARMSTRNLRKWLRLSRFSRYIFSQFTAVLAQHKLDARRFKLAGAQNILVFSNLKFDTAHHTHDGLASEKKFALPHKKIFCVASMRAGEEQHILQAWHKCCIHDPRFIEYLLLLVPRHLTAVAQIQKQAQALGFSWALRSQLPILKTGTQILIGDTLNEMAMYLSASDAVLIGGSLLPLGGQNFIEACTLGKPVLMGPYMFNFMATSALAVRCGAAKKMSIQDLLQLDHVMQQFLTDDQSLGQMGRAGLKFVAQHHGASDKTCIFLSKILCG